MFAFPLHCQPFWLGREGDDKFSNQLGVPKPMLIVITTFLAYGLIVFIYRDAISSNNSGGCKLDVINLQEEHQLWPITKDNPRFFSLNKVV
jgi:hypothetical protein